MPWHTEVLKAEFSAADSGEIASLGDYLALEDALFTAMNTRIYDHTETGPAHALERYSRGSLADPAGRQHDWNRSFELPATDASGGVLLLHGMSDSPYSLRALGEALQASGYHVLGLRMPGHGTLPSGLLRLHWHDMSAAVHIGMRHLAARLRDKPLHILGYSTGAALALDYALENGNGVSPVPLASLVLVSPAVGLSPAAGLAGWMRRLGSLPGLERLAWLSIEPEFDPYKYNSFTTNAAEQVNGLTRSVSARIAAREPDAAPLPPILAIKSTVDATVSNDVVVDRLLGPLSDYRHELLVFDINRAAANRSLLTTDPGPFTRRLVEDTGLHFAVTLVTNSNPATREVSAFHKPAFAAGPARVEALGMAWPPGVFSLSHVALPFPPDDPLYGSERPAETGALFLGTQALQGERGVLAIPGDFLLRLRHNPFYRYQEQRILDWLRNPGNAVN
jgi:alpha-beta hydrolase superfamily lysophospholipase